MLEGVRRVAGKIQDAGFTLLEVLVAIAILGLGLTVILSSQVGLFSSASRTTNLSHATNLARCRMNEVEVELLEKGYPLIDQEERGRCCGDDDNEGYSCVWRIQRVELPELESPGLGADGGTTDLGPLGALAEAQQSQGESLGEEPSLSDLAGSMEEATANGMQGMATMLFGYVYPDLKPLLEASIRKVTVIVQWKEGRNERDLRITQYLTDPRQGGLQPPPEGPGAAEGVGP